jgi:hemolysin D
MSKETTKNRIPDPRRWLQNTQDLLESSIHSEHEEVVLRQSRFWARAITWTLMGGTAFGLAWLAFAQTEEIVVAPGKLEPISRVVEVQMPLQGVTKRILVKEGERVKKGQVLIQLDTEASNSRSTKTEIQ